MHRARLSFFCAPRRDAWEPSAASPAPEGAPARGVARVAFPARRIRYARAARVQAREVPCT
eukprot:3352671-Pleurochrysis_carterae.AAC.1